VFHDCSPPKAIYERLDHCGTVWRAWVELRRERPGSFVVDTDLGCGVIGPWEQPCLAPPATAPDAPWEMLDERRAAWLNLVSPDRFLELIADGSRG
jgi:hypothetical protein